MKKFNKVFMAVGKSVEFKEYVPAKKYTGISPVSVLAVNPSKAELDKIYNRESQNDPVYVGTNKAGKPQIRIDFIVKTAQGSSVKEKVDLTSRVSFFISDDKRVNKDGTKVQVIDKYGRTAWVTSEDFKAKNIPMYSNGPAQLDSDYRAIYNGEEQLTQFIKAYCGIANLEVYKDGKWVKNSDVKPEDCECRLDNIEKYFKGDVSELKGIINDSLKVCVLFVVSGKDGKMYQNIYNGHFARTTNSRGFEKAVNDAKASGGMQNVETSFGELVEYSVTATNLDKPSEEASDLPFGDATDPFNA